MNMITAAKNYIALCPYFADFPLKKRHINWLEDDPDNYGIYPTGDEVLETYLNGDEERLYTFTVEIRRMLDLDYKRLEAMGFLENVAEWFYMNPPSEFPEDCETIEITPRNSMLLDMDKSGKKGTYQIQIAIKYIKYYGGI